MEFMSNHGGMNNAYTSLTNTNYHFDCSNDAFPEGLDRLSQFFICPSFSENSSEREVKAVDSEFNQSLQSDMWHFFNLMMRISNKESLLNRFACGNVKSLSNENMRASLLEFHKKWYSANIMTLTISSKLSLEEMEKLATERFSPVKNFDVTVPDLGEVPPFP
jgi:insulysin